jgi:hypothetical protein
VLYLDLNGTISPKYNFWLLLTPTPLKETA